jgi:hypothetical protein
MNVPTDDLSEPAGLEVGTGRVIAGDVIQVSNAFDDRGQPSHQNGNKADDRP